MGITRIFKIGVRHGDVNDGPDVYFQCNSPVISTDRAVGRTGRKIDEDTNFLH